MITCSNINTNQMQHDKVFVIWIDVRKSTNLNKLYEDNQLHNMYKEALNTIDEVLRRHGFSNIDIQGDGIYGVSNMSSESVLNCVIELNERIVNKIGDPDGGHLMTMSVHYGKEVYSCFGQNANQMAFFGNVVTDAKEWIGNSMWNDSKKTRIIMSIEAYNKMHLSSNKKSNLNISLKGKKNKKYKGYYE